MESVVVVVIIILIIVGRRRALVFLFSMHDSYSCTVSVLYHYVYPLSLTHFPFLDCIVLYCVYIIIKGIPDFHYFLFPSPHNLVSIPQL